MTAARRTMISIALLGIYLAGLTAVSFLWVLPSLRELRTTIDNDRASTILIQQQQSNLDQLRSDLQAIKDKQVELEKNIWTFQTEDSFFTAISSITTQRRVTGDPPVMADATPNGTLQSRIVTFTIDGSLSAALGFLTDLEQHSPLIAIQQVVLAPGDTSATVQATITATTLWK